jgi:hypothetical protein
MPEYTQEDLNKMKEPTMLYKHPGPHAIHGSFFDHIVVDIDEIEDAIKAGWSRTTTEAKDLFNGIKKEVEKIEAEIGITGDNEPKEDPAPGGWTTK